MKKKISTLLLIFLMVFTLGTSAFAEGNLNLSAGIESMLMQMLNRETYKVELVKDKMKLDSESKYVVNHDVSALFYTLNLKKDTDINFDYKTNSNLYLFSIIKGEILNVNQDLDDLYEVEDTTIWSDTLFNLTNQPKEMSNKVGLKLKKGKYTVMALSTKGQSSITPNVTTLKSMSPFKVDAVLPGSSAVTGKGVVGAKVTVTDESGKNYTTTVKSDSTFKVKVPKQREYSSLILKMQKNGYDSKLKTIIVEYGQFKTFTVNEITTSSTAISGKGLSGATVRAFVGDKKIGETKVKSNGTYSMKIKKQSGGKSVKVKIYKSGYETKSKVVTVKKVFANKLTVNSVKSSSKVITGKGTKNATVKAYVNNKEIGKTTVNSKGAYTIKIPKQAKGKVITVKMSAKGYVTVSKNVTVK